VTWLIFFAKMSSQPTALFARFVFFQYVLLVVDSILSSVAFIFMVSFAVNSLATDFIFIFALVLSGIASVCTFGALIHLLYNKVLYEETWEAENNSIATPLY
jgi:hypothetical protein